MNSREIIPKFELWDNPQVNIRTGEFTNILPDGSPGPTGDMYKEILIALAKKIAKDKGIEFGAEEKSNGF